MTGDATSDEIRRGVERAALAAAFAAAIANDQPGIADALLSLDSHQRQRLFHAAQRLARACRHALPARAIAPPGEDTT